ncbi:hypothetical protein L6452_19830 [Arctium lappa]|uniref:Uncharacterized protein n=1 Tax=Arctium lappa TaxID=4217 RepID=A0ACB9BE30_ARCLA|nr:hypothetical protein L6452_19830 [Arctium lappa]
MYPRMLDLLQLYYSWPHEMDADVLAAFRCILNNRYPDIMRDARQFSNAMALQIDGVQFDGQNYTVLAAHPPEWIRSKFWVQMIEQACICGQYNQSGHRV